MSLKAFADIATIFFIQFYRVINTMAAKCRNEIDPFALRNDRSAFLFFIAS